MASAIIDQLFGVEAEETKESSQYNLEAKHFGSLLDRISSDLGIERGTIVDFELNVVDS